MDILTGVLLIIIGALIAVFRKSVGAAFCRFGKQSWRDSPFGLSKSIESTYDEKKAPWVFLVIGMALVVMGILHITGN